MRKIMKTKTNDNQYTFAKTEYWLGNGEPYDLNCDELPKFTVNKVLVQACAIQHLKEKIKHWQDDNYDIEDMIHSLESVIRKFEDVQKNVING